jgi:hypothetical protein
MALHNLARVTTATTGTGTITLGAAVPGFLSFASAGVVNGEVVSYGIKDGNNSEVGTGTYTSAGTTLTRTVLASTNAGAAISLSGLAEVFITVLAQDMDAKAPLASPVFTGDPTAPTPTTADNDVSIATTAFVKAQGYITSSALSPYAPLASPALSGTPTAPTPGGGDNDTSIATTAFVQGEITAKAPLASPVFTGNPTAPTPSDGDNDTSIATTAFVRNGVALGASANFNNVTASGSYYTVDGNSTNYPSSVGAGQFYYLYVLNYLPAAHLLQICSAMDGAATGVWVRQRYNSVWTAWRQIAHSDSPVFSGNPTAPTPSANDNDTSIATTAFVLGQLSSSTPAALSGGSAGSATTFARGDHAHPSGFRDLAFSAPSQDLNSTSNLIQGYYEIYSPTNGPSEVTSDWCLLRVHRHSNGAVYYGVQFLTTMTQSPVKYWIREFVNGTFGSWKRLDNFVSKTGDTMTGSLGISASDPFIGLNKAASGESAWIQGQKGGVGRWQVTFGDGTAETGSNAGSDFSIIPIADGGSSLGACIGIKRSTGLMTLKGDPTAALGAATKEYVDNRAPLRGHIDGLILSTAGSSTTVTTAAGQATDSTAAQAMTLASALAKTSSAWAVGTSQGGLDTGSISGSATWYHFYLIKRTDTGVVDVIFSTSASAPTLPTNYSLYRRIGACRWNGSTWVKFIQKNDTFMWDVPVSNLATSNPGTTAVLQTMTVPTGISVEVLLSLGGTCLSSDIGPGAIYISDPALSDQVPAVFGACTLEVYDARGTGIVTFGAQARCFSNTSAQVRYRCELSSSNVQFSINTNGWVDPRGRNA